MEGVDPKDIGKNGVAAYEYYQSIKDEDSTSIRPTHRTQTIQNLARDYILLRNALPKAILTNVSGTKSIGEASEMQAKNELARSRNSNVSIYATALKKLFDFSSFSAHLTGRRQAKAKKDKFDQHIKDVFIAWPVMDKFKSDVINKLKNFGFVPEGYI